MAASTTLGFKSSSTGSYPIVWTDVLEPYGTAASADKLLAVFGALSFRWMASVFHAVARSSRSSQTARKAGAERRQWYAMVDLERVSREPTWLDKAIRIVDRLVREANGKQNGKGWTRPLRADGWVLTTRPND